MLRGLARDTEQAAIIEAVESVIATNQALSPNLNSGGSRD